MMLEFDELQMYFGKDYVVNQYVTIHSPTVGEVIDFGEADYFSTVHSLTCIPSDMKSQLFDMGLDYEEVPDFDLFIMLSRVLPRERTKILFGNLDFTQFEVCADQDGKKYMVNRNTHAIIDELAYMKIAGYLRKYHNITPKIERAKTKTVKKLLIQLDRERIQHNKNTGYESQLKPLISAMMRYPGFKYKSHELVECSLYEFMDTVRGAQIYVSSTALLKGMYSGMIDTSKINKKELNWMRDE